MHCECDLVMLIISLTRKAGYGQPCLAEAGLGLPLVHALACALPYTILGENCKMCRRQMDGNMAGVYWGMQHPNLLILCPPINGLSASG